LEISQAEAATAVGSQIKIRPYQAGDEAAVIALWQAGDLLRPQNDPRKEIVRKLKVNPEWFLVAEADGQLRGVIMAGYEGRRGWINSFAVDPSYRRRGIGRALMAEAERLLRAAGCPKINLQVRPDHQEVVEFYRQLGFAVEPLISMGKRLEVD
jgi:ribosomal protein S18 acetylase RimI-like enzyme